MTVLPLAGIVATAAIVIDDSPWRRTEMADRIKGILFDLGDTLLDFGEVDIPSLFEQGARLAHEYLRELGCRPPSLAKYHRRQLWAIRWNYFKSYFTRREFDSLDLLDRLSTKLGQTLTKDQLVELAWLWYRPLRKCATAEPGLREILAQFRRAGLVMGIVSNTFVAAQVLDRHLDEEGLLELLPVRVYSCDVGYRKPNPNIFEIARCKIGLQASEVVFVGDSPAADIRGANNAGMISVLKDPAGKYNGQPVGATRRIKSITELPDVIAELDQA